MAVRWRMPPEISCGYRRSKPFNPTSPIKCRARSSRSDFAMPVPSSGSATFSMTVRQGNVLSSWNTMPMWGVRGAGADGLAIDADASLPIIHQPTDHAEQRGFAAAGRADDRHELTGAHVEADVLHRRDTAAGAAEPLGRAVHLEHGGGEARSRRRVEHDGFSHGRYTGVLLGRGQVHRAWLSPPIQSCCRHASAKLRRCATANSYLVANQECSGARAMEGDAARTFSPSTSRGFGCVPNLSHWG